MARKMKIPTISTQRGRAGVHKTLITCMLKENAEQSNMFSSVSSVLFVLFGMMYFHVGRFGLVWFDLVPHFLGIYVVVEVTSLLPNCVEWPARGLAITMRTAHVIKGGTRDRQDRSWLSFLITSSSGRRLWGSFLRSLVTRSFASSLMFW